MKIQRAGARRALSWAAASMLAAAGLPIHAAAQTQEFVGIEWTGRVFALDESTGAGSLVGDWGLGAGANATATLADGTVIVAQRDPADPKRSRLARLDTLNGAGSLLPIAPLPFDVRGMAFDSTGRLLAVADGGVQNDRLFIVDIGTGNSLLVGTTPFSAVQALALGPDGVLHGWDVFAGLVRIDAATAAGIDVNPKVGATDQVQFLAASIDGTLIAGNAKLFRVDRATGELTLLGTGDYSDLRGADFTGFVCAENFGKGCHGSGGFTPRLFVEGCPRVGEQLTVAVDRGLGGTVALLVFGTPDQALPLPDGCMYHAGAINVVAIVPLGGKGAGNGNVFLSAYVPKAAAGGVFALQAFTIDLGVARGFANSDGLLLRVQ